MPILPAEPFLRPEDLFDSPAAPRPEGGRWWVLHTRPRAEKSLARQCVARQLSFFLPLRRHYTHSRGRTLTSYMPLFPGYVFLLADEDARVSALTTNLVVNCLPVPDQARLEDDLRGVHRLMLSGMTVVREEQLVPGTPVEIVSGPLAGLRGQVLG
ncbi:MAG TPA: transcription termination/antitermination NusG family protein, partial [Gemmataceae bacterium]|nr:transcription termination/antitermination NusG family protein [Gemmataceae bacterium]